MHLPIRAENKNINGATTDASLFVRGVAILRYGRPLSRTHSNFFNSTTVQTLKIGPGTLHRVILVRNGAIGGNTVTLYDNTSAAGTVIGQLSFGSSTGDTFEYDVDFDVGLTVDPGSANFQTTVVWE